MDTVEGLLMKNKVKEKIYPGWMCVPALGIYTLFYIVPIAAAFFFSFTDWNMDRMNAPKFAGLRNFINLFGDEVFLRSAGNTMLFAVMTTVLKLAVGLALALLVVQKFKGNGFFRTLFYLPCVLSCMIIGLLFTGILKMDGLLNNALRAVGMECSGLFLLKSGCGRGLICFFLFPACSPYRRSFMRAPRWTGQAHGNGL